MTDYFSILLLLPLLIVLSSGLTIFMSTMVKNMEDFGITGTPDEISGTPDPFHPDLGHVYGTVRLYAQY